MKIKQKNNALVIFSSLFVAIVAIDQYFKYKVRHFGGFYICNSGISFNIQIPYLLFWLFLAFLGFIFFIFHHRNVFRLPITVALALISAGAVSNILDRVIIGCAIDYISIFKVFFPIFNLGDCSIFFGFLLVLFDSFYFYRPKSL